ncbi:hypothetical protein IAR50_007160 [Cryptococcus sp. DSM 104548]
MESRSRSTRRTNHHHTYARQEAPLSPDDIEVTFDDPEDLRKFGYTKEKATARDLDGDETIEIEGEYETDSEQKKDRRRDSKRQSRREKDASRRSSKRPYWENPEEWWNEENGAIRMPPPMGEYALPPDTESEGGTVTDSVVNEDEEDEPKARPNHPLQDSPDMRHTSPARNPVRVLPKVSASEGLLILSSETSAIPIQFEVQFRRFPGQELECL